MQIPRWREDFPIDWDQDEYITRRELAKFLALGSGLLAVASGLIAAAGNWIRRVARPIPRQQIGFASSIPVGGSLLFRYPTEEDPCILIRAADGSLKAYSQICTHLSCAVVHRPETQTLFCPCHHGYFSVTEGRPFAGPPTRRLPQVRLEQRGDEIFAVGKEV